MRRRHKIRVQWFWWLFKRLYDIRRGVIWNDVSTGGRNPTAKPGMRESMGDFFLHSLRPFPPFDQFICWKCLIKTTVKQWCYISNTNSSVSLRFQTTRKLLKHEGLRARVFYCFRVVCHGNETRRMSVWNNFSNEWNGINCFSWYLRTLECTAIIIIIIRSRIILIVLE